MPRKTRNTARAQDGEIQIAGDDTQTAERVIALKHEHDEGRLILQQVNGNLLEQQSLKADTKKGKSIRKGTKKATNGKADKRGVNEESSDEVKSESSQNDDIGKDGSPKITTLLSPILPNSGAAQGEASPEATVIPSPAIEIAQSPSDNTGFLRDNATASPPSNLIEETNEAGQKLESLFDQPKEAVPSESEEPVINEILSRSTNKPPQTEGHNKGLRSGSSTLKVKGSKTSTTKAKKSPVTVAKKNSVKMPAKKPTARVSIEKAPASTPLKAVSKPRASISALNTPPPVIKSSKEPTKSTFALPSEAVKEKLKQQKEDRLKRMEEKEKERKTVPPGGVKPAAKPAVKSTAKSTMKPAPNAAADMSTKSMTQPLIRAKMPEVRETAASRARLSMATSRKTMSPVKPRLSISKQTIAPTMKRASINPTPVKAGTVRPVKRPSMTGTIKPKISTLAHRPHLSHAQGKTTSSTANTVSTVKERPALTSAEKAEAARRARAEAAERGRQASREWAEKMKAKQQATKVGQVKLSEDPATVSLA